MKRTGKVALPVVVILLILSTLLGYVLGASTGFGFPRANLSENDELIGIWQANAFMASGWSDRYQFMRTANITSIPA